ncbi:hypothetical protein [Mangrovitalea sediminis]|uniref:hypothetical protein n=1 Tax=Mangrovitalea sediminis TaxID=1982043 RepID=UPI000BE5136F|nr:hypothetical protein [Mangrovitalea sediminis]
MTKPILHGLFEIDKTHRLQVEPAIAASGVRELPYTVMYFGEWDSDGRQVARIRFWEAFGGRLCGAEYLDLEGNILHRSVKSRRAAARDQAA